MSRSLPPFRTLLAFRAAATHDRLLDAAARLGVTESAVSHQIRQLETLLAARLFDRTPAGLRLTADGRHYLERIDPALREIEAATAAFLPAPGRAPVRLTLPPSLAATWLVPRLGAFEATHPGIDLKIVATTRILDFSRDGVDAAIRHGKGGWPGVAATFLFEDLATPVAAPGLLAAGAAPAAVLKGARLIVNRSIPDEWVEWARARGFEPPDLDGALALDAIEQVLAVAEAGHGVAMGRLPYIGPALARGTLVAPFGTAGPTGAAYFLCEPEGRQPTAPVRALKRWLLEAARSSPREAAAEAT